MRLAAAELVAQAEIARANRAAHAGLVGSARKVLLENSRWQRVQKALRQKVLRENFAAAIVARAGIVSVAKRAKARVALVARVGPRANVVAVPSAMPAATTAARLVSRKNRCVIAKLARS